MTPSSMQRDFAKQYIKGKIGELIFEQMFREAGGYIVIPFGYETAMPDIIEHTRRTRSWELLDGIRNAPDYALISHDPEKIRLVEIKYRSKLDQKDVIKTAKSVHERWKLAHLFYATQGGFYFDACNILAAGSKMEPLPDTMVSKPLQKKYLLLLKEFVN